MKMYICAIKKIVTKRNETNQVDEAERRINYRITESES